MEAESEGLEVEVFVDVDEVVPSDDIIDGAGIVTVVEGEVNDEQQLKVPYLSILQQQGQVVGGFSCTGGSVGDI